MRLVLAFLLLSQLVTGSIMAHAIQVNSTPVPISIHINLRSPSVQQGSAVRVTIRMTNTSNRTVTLGAEFFVHGELDSRFDYDCRDESGKSVKKSYPITTSVGDRPIITLKPGEGHEEDINLANACNLEKAGRYRVQLSRTSPEDPQQQTIKSNTITVNITPSSAQ